MTRPGAFTDPYFVPRELNFYPPFCSADLEAPSIGVLKAGQTVWLDANTHPETIPPPVNAFADGIGIISVDPRFLSHVPPNDREQKAV